MRNALRTSPFVKQNLNPAAQNQNKSGWYEIIVQVAVCKSHRLILEASNPTEAFDIALSIPELRNGEVLAITALKNNFFFAN